MPLDLVVIAMTEYRQKYENSEEGPALCISGSHRLRLLPASVLSKVECQRRRQRGMQPFAQPSPPVVPVVLTTTLRSIAIIANAISSNTHEARFDKKAANGDEIFPSHMVSHRLAFVPRWGPGWRWLDTGGGLAGGGRHCHGVCRGRWSRGEPGTSASPGSRGYIPLATPTTPNLLLGLGWVGSHFNLPLCELSQVSKSIG